MSFEPIAIVGQSCLLPGAHTPNQLWNHVLAGKDCLTTVPEDYWDVELNEVLKGHPEALEDVTDSLRGGYVDNFSAIFDPQLFANKFERILREDVICQWLIHAGHFALQPTYNESTKKRRKRAGAIVGNLSYPTLGLSEYAQAVWLTERPHKFLDQTLYKKLLAKKQYPSHRFMSGYPIHFMADILGLSGPVYAIDAACASSLYAMKLACDALQTGQADLMLAGGINHADDLFLHIGFSVLQALSKSGQSRPLHRHADGLIPAQGVALVALKRLQDAIKDENKIYGVIKGIGLSNDGKTSGFLLPSKEGQLRAMQMAYQASNIHPTDIGWLECHATGTPAGDRIEIESILELFSQNSSLCLGTLKANIGHTITASGAAALINVLCAFEHKVKPPTRLIHPEAIDLLENGNFKLLSQPEPWICQDGTRYAAINNFGFGGNNAHLVIQDYAKQKIRASKKTQPSLKDDIAIIAVGIKSGEANSKKIEQIELPIQGIRFPPIDLDNTLGQQLILLALLKELLAEIPSISPEKTSAFIGMQCDAEIARYSLKWRLSKLFHNAEQQWLKQARTKIMPPLTAAHVIGCMPNIVTNRLNQQFGFRCPSFSVSAEELSGIRGLQIAIQALQNCEIDNAIVGAVDLSCELVSKEAIKAIFPKQQSDVGDAAVILILKRMQEALQNNDKIYGLLNYSLQQKVDREITSNNNETEAQFGYTHTANGLLNVAVLAMQPYQQFNLTPEKKDHAVKIHCQALGNVTSSIILQKKDKYL